MKLKTKTNKTHGFTLIEMIGVLAVIAILAALLIPKVFRAITEAKINTVPVGASTCKTATIDYYAKYGAFQTNASPTFPINDYDGTVLLPAGLIDKPFAVKVGTAADVILDACDVATSTADEAFNLDGVNPVNDATGTHVVYAKIDGVPIADAQEISARIDGTALSQAEGATTADAAGRVKYAAPASAGAPVSVFIYLTHR